MLDEICDRFRASADFAGIGVFSAPVDKLRETTNVVFGDIDTEQAWAALAPSRPRKEDYTLEGVVRIVQAGVTEEASKKARDRAHGVGLALGDAVLAMQDDLSDIAETIGATQVTELTLTTFKLLQGGNPGKNRIAQFAFEINVTTRI